jgi:hypothetical protein
VNKAKDKACTEKIVQGIYTAEKDTKEVIKEIEYFNKRSVMFVIS